MEMADYKRKLLQEIIRLALEMKLFLRNQIA